MNIGQKALILENMEWLSDDTTDGIEYVSKRYGVSSEIASKAILLSHDIIGARSSVQMTRDMSDVMKDVLDKNELLSDIEDVERLESELLTLLGRTEKMSLNDFSLRYLSILEDKRGEDKDFDDFLNWLQDNKDYGIISSFCEFCEPGEYGRLRCIWERENITVDSIKKLIST